MKISLILFSYLLLITTSFAKEVDSVGNTASDKPLNTALRSASNQLSQRKISKKIALESKNDFESSILKAWHIPIGLSNQSANARINLSNDGSVNSYMIHSSNSKLKASISKAILDAAPFPMPSDPDARREARYFQVKFIVK